MTDRVTVTIDAGIADVRFNRADKRNALDADQCLAILETGERLASAPGVRVVVLSGEGSSFCAGLDLSLFEVVAAGSGFGASGHRGDPTRLTESGLTHVGQQIAWLWQELPVPVIAAVHGHALGGGLQIALGADVRITHPEAQWSVREMYWGLIPDMTGTLALSRLVRPDVARELTYTARIFDGVEAHALGIATRVSEQPYDDAMALAAEIAGRNPDAIRGAKALFHRLYADGAPAQFAQERRVVESLLGSPNQLEAIAANLARRPPRFTD